MGTKYEYGMTTAYGGVWNINDDPDTVRAAIKKWNEAVEEFPKGSTEFYPRAWLVQREAGNSQAIWTDPDPETDTTTREVEA